MIKFVPAAYRPYPRRLEMLTILRFDYKESIILLFRLFYLNQ